MLGYPSLTLSRLPFTLALCTTEASFRRQMRELSLTEAIDWIPAGAHAATHRITGANGGFVIVTIKHDPRRSRSQEYALLVHEAMHVWRFARDHWGEREPSIEFEAYAMQSITQALFSEFDRKAKLDR